MYTIFWEIIWTGDLRKWSLTVSTCICWGIHVSFNIHEPEATVYGYNVNDMTVDPWLACAHHVL